MIGRAVRAWEGAVAQQGEGCVANSGVPSPHREPSIGRGSCRADAPEAFSAVRCRGRPEGFKGGRPAARSSSVQ